MLASRVEYPFYLCWLLLDEFACHFCAGRASQTLHLGTMEFIHAREHAKVQFDNVKSLDSMLKCQVTLMTKPITHVQLSDIVGCEKKVRRHARLYDMYRDHKNRHPYVDLSTILHLFYPATTQQYCNTYMGSLYDTALELVKGGGQLKRCHIAQAIAIINNGTVCAHYGCLGCMCVFLSTSQVLGRASFVLGPDFVGLSHHLHMPCCAS